MAEEVVSAAVRELRKGGSMSMDVDYHESWPVARAKLEAEFPGAHLQRRHGARTVKVTRRQTVTLIVVVDNVDHEVWIRKELIAAFGGVRAAWRCIEQSLPSVVKVQRCLDREEEVFYRLTPESAHDWFYTAVKHDRGLRRLYEQRWCWRRVRDLFACEYPSHVTVPRLREIVEDFGVREVTYRVNAWPRQFHGFLHGKRISVTVPKP